MLAHRNTRRSEVTDIPFMSFPNMQHLNPEKPLQ